MYKYGIDLISSLLVSIQGRKRGLPNEGIGAPDGSVERPLKRRKRSGNESISDVTSAETPPPLLDWMPDDILQCIIPYACDIKTHRSLQLTCRKMQKMTNLPNHLRKLNLGGDRTNSHRDILLGIDSQDEAISKLYKYAKSGNIGAIYMIGMIGVYCYGSKLGVSVLKYAKTLGCDRSAYTLGLILRDSSKEESDAYLEYAIQKDYLPACKEVFSSDEMKQRYGELTPGQLKKYFDATGLKELIGRTFLTCQGVRKSPTSHCWNPKCSRWAFKTSSNRGISRKIYPSFQPHMEAQISEMIDVSPPQCENKEGINITQQTCSIVDSEPRSIKVSRMKICSSCRRAKYCSKLCQVYDWRSQRHKMECHYLSQG